MEIPLEYAYLVGTVPLLVLWLALYHVRPDLRREMRVMSLFVGVVSLASGYLW